MKPIDYIYNDLYNPEDRNNLTTSKKSRIKSSKTKHPDPKKHKFISFIKSGIRIIACTVGFAGNLEAKMESRLMATIGQAGFCGSMESDVAMTGSIDAYVWGFCGGWTVATNGNLKVSVGCGQVGSVSGTVNIPLPFGYTQTVGVSLSL
jgi:hypothetical protein